MDDLIRRQDAIDAMGIEPLAFSEYENGLHDKWESNVEALMNLPSAEPERKNEPAGCNGCRYDWFGDPRCAKCSRSFQDHYEAEREEE